MESTELIKKLRSAKFIGEKLSRHYNAIGEKEIVVVGRSNCGKSTFLSKLFDNNKLVKTSKSPGHTTQLNNFQFMEDFYMVDSPGYGYAKMDRATAKGARRALQSYLTKCDQLVGLLHIWDIRRDFDEQDVLLWELTERLQNRAFVVTKCDKISRTNQAKRLKELHDMCIAKNIAQSPVLLPFSALNKSGLPAIYETLAEWVEWVVDYDQQ